MFKSDASLFLSANNNVSYAKTLINECKRLINDYNVPSNQNFNNCKKSINDCNINALVEKIETTRESLLKLDKDFATEYMTLLQENLTTAALSYQTMSSEEQFEYNLNAKDYDYALLYMLEQYESEGKLTKEMEEQLKIQRIKIEQYKLNDSMSGLSISSKEYIEKFKQNAELDKELIKIMYSGEEASQKLNEYDIQFKENLASLELNYSIGVKSDELKKLEPGSEAYYKKDNEIRQLQIDYYNNRSDLTEEERKIIEFQKDYIELNNYYIMGDVDKARTKKTQMFDPFTGKCIATSDEVAYENADWWGRAWMNTKTVGATVVTSMGGVGETLVDGTVMLTAGTVGLFSDDVAKWTEDFVSVNWSDDAYEGMVISGGLNEYSAHSGFHTVTDFITTTGTYIGLSFIPGLGGSAVMAVSASGNTGQTALDNGATLKEAVGASWVAGGLAFAADVGLDKLNASANVSQMSKITGRTAIGVGEPALNAIAEYSLYGHKNSESLFEYAEKTGAFTNMTIGGLVTNVAGLFGDYQKSKMTKLEQYKVDFNNQMDSMTDVQRSQSWVDYYSGKYGDINVEHSSGIDIDDYKYVNKNINNIFDEVFGNSDPVISRKLARMIDLYGESQLAAIEKYNVGFKSYRDHAVAHAYYVSKYVYDLSKTVDGIDVDETLFAAFAHDLGMSGGFVKYDGIYTKADEVLELLRMSGKEISFNDINSYIRKPHPLNSALTILTDDVIPDNLDKDVVALLAMTHSKSTSGISYFNSFEQWNKCVDELEQALVQYNKTNGTAFVLDTTKLKGMISNPIEFERLQKQALIIRDGDAMSQVATIDGNTVMQTGNVGVVVNDNPRTKYNKNASFESNKMAFDEPVVDEKTEISKMSDRLKTNSGVYIEGEDGDISSGVKFHAGELNTQFSTTTDGLSYYRATVDLVEPNQVPNSTLYAIEERIGEVRTYSNCKTREFVVNLPKAAENTALGNWYDAEIKKIGIELKQQAYIDYDKGIIDKTTLEKQLSFFENIRVEFV